MEYDINDIKSFENIKIIYNEKLKKNDDTNLIYLIGIKNNSEEKTKIEAMNFSSKNNLKYFSISDKNENDIKSFLKNLMHDLEKETIKKINKDEKDDESEDDVYKVCFIGSSGSGAKTSLINAIIGKTFDPGPVATSICSFVIKKIKVKNNKTIQLNLWDTIGQEQFREFTKLFFTNVDCFVLGFDVTSFDSFNEIPIWYKIAKESVDVNLMYLICNKIDLITERKISEKDAINLAKEYNLRYFETSCATGEGIQKFLNDLANEIIKHKISK